MKICLLEHEWEKIQKDLAELEDIKKNLVKVDEVVKEGIKAIQFKFEMQKRDLSGEDILAMTESLAILSNYHQ